MAMGENMHTYTVTNDETGEEMATISDSDNRTAFSLAGALAQQENAIMVIRKDGQSIRFGTVLPDGEASDERDEDEEITR
jgi:hypothetical protein